MADVESVGRVEKIVKSDPARKYIVVSAPGKCNGGAKVTDLLIQCFEEIKNGGNCDRTFPSVAARYRDIYDCLGSDILDKTLFSVKDAMEKSGQYDFCVSRGEYLSAYFFALKTGFGFVDAAELLRFDKYDGFNAAETDKICKKRLRETGYIVIPGFYGSDENGNIVIFSRGGSDITGSLVAAAVKADIYENWTDVDGILNADPRIVQSPEIISSMTYGELREMSYLGAAVMHPDALVPLIKTRTPLAVRNTFRPETEGTLITSCLKERSETGSGVTGIVGKKGFSVLFVHKTGMNAQKNVVRKILSVLEYYGIGFEHMPSSIDAVNFLIPKENVSEEVKAALVDEIKKSVRPDDIRMVDNFAIVSIVGRNMRSRLGVAGRMCTALAKAGVNIRMLIQGLREINIIAGVDERQYETAVRALYDEFLAEKRRIKRGFRYL